MHTKGRCVCGKILSILSHLDGCKSEQPWDTPLHIHFTAVTKRINSNKWQWRHGEDGELRKCKTMQLLRRTVWHFLQELKIELLYDPEILLSPMNWKYVYIRSWTWMFKAALCILGRIDSAQCPSIIKHINKIQHIHSPVLSSLNKEWSSNTHFNIARYCKH